MNSGQTSSGTLLCRFRILCARQRWRSERGRHSSIARMTPGAPSMATKSGSGRPRRRTKVIPRAFGERAVLKLMYAALIRAAECWRGIKITEFEQRQLKAIREEIDQDFTARNAPTAGATVTTAPTRLSSNDRT